MTTSLPFALHVALIGVVATAVMDLGSLAMHRLGLPMPDYALVGRWLGHMPGGRFAHDSIARAAPLGHEAALGWLTHYAVGIAYAALLVAVAGADWMRQPTFVPALAVGLATLAVPLFVMQPAMGSGVAGTRTPAPLKTLARSVANHAVFGCGLYLGAVLLAAAQRMPNPG